jgi:hypothetical protein
MHGWQQIKELVGESELVWSLPVRFELGELQNQVLMPSLSTAH